MLLHVCLEGNEGGSDISMCCLNTKWRNKYYNIYNTPLFQLKLLQANRGK